MLEYLKRKYNSNKQIWVNKKPNEKWEVLRKVGDCLLSFVGVRVLSDCKINWNSYVPLFIMIQYLSLITYTIFYYGKRDRVFEGLPCLCLSGTVIAVMDLSVFSLQKNFSIKC